MSKEADNQYPTHRLPSERREVVVVGGGQAGMAIGYFLAQRGRDFVILEAAEEPAAAWHERWDSLKLFTPVRYDSLPGLAFELVPGSDRRSTGSYYTPRELVAELVEHALVPVLEERLEGAKQAGGVSPEKRAGRGRQVVSRPTVGRPTTGIEAACAAPSDRAAHAGPAGDGAPQRLWPVGSADRPAGAHQ